MKHAFQRINFPTSAISQVSSAAVPVDLIYFGLLDAKKKAKANDT